jgi:hypothetical protein
MEMADYAERNEAGIDNRLIQELRSDVLHIRFSALKTYLTRTPVA